MEFLTTTILSGLLWDGLKKIGIISSDYVKEKLKDWIIDEENCQKIADKINNISDGEKRTEKFLDASLEEDGDFVALLKEIQKNKNNIQFIKDSDFNNSTIVAGDGNTINNSYFSHLENLDNIKKKENK